MRTDQILDALGLPYPIAKRLGAAADLGRNRADGFPLRIVFAPMFGYHTNRPPPYLQGITLSVPS